MTLLGVLFVTGVAFLATMNFEAEMIAADQVRVSNEEGVDSVIDQFSALLRDGLVTEGSVPFSGEQMEAPFAIDPQQGSSPLGYAELPGVHNLFSPSEPYQDFTAGGILVRFPWFTDVESLMNAGDWELNPDQSIDTERPSGIGGQCAGGPDDGAWCPIDSDCPGGVCTKSPDPALRIPIPVDADGDGITDTFQFPLASSDFSESQLATLSAQVSPANKPDGEVYFGLRVLAHGGMVNLNESHPNLIANALDVQVGDLLNDGESPEPDIIFFRHRPSQGYSDFYSPWLEEPMLRRRGILPPRVLTPSLLHGNPLLSLSSNELSSAVAEADMPTRLFPPDFPQLYDHPDFDFETVREGGHRYTPFTIDELYDSGGPNPWSLWTMRMEPVASYQDDPSGAAYDRRHLVTTISYDDLLARGGRWVERDEFGELTGATDLLEKMRESNRAANVPAPDFLDILPFEYADYPQDVLNQDVPNTEGIDCDSPTRSFCDAGANAGVQCTNDDACGAGICVSACRFAPQKGRLQLSLPWLDELVTDLGYGPEIRNRLIHDVFMMLVRNARGPYWEEIDSSFNVNPNACETWGEVSGCTQSKCNGGARDAQVCTVGAGDCPGGACECAGLCDGGDFDGQQCFALADCADAGAGGNCIPQEQCYVADTDQSHAQSMLSRTAASLTANMIDFMDFVDDDGDDVDDGRPTRIALRSFDFDDPGSAGSDLFSSYPAGTPLVRQFVYGLERQPFITEVATVGLGGVNVPPDSWAVELFNPYDVDIDLAVVGNEGYYLVEIDATALPAVAYANRKIIPLNGKVAAGGFTVFTSGSGFVGVVGGTVVLNNPNDLKFENGWILYLVRRLDYPEPGNPSNTVDVVVDQFTVGGSGAALNIGTGGAAATPYSIQRALPGPPAASPWKAPVPARMVEVSGHSLGTWNADDPSIYPVEVRFANTGSFTRSHPNDSTTNPTMGVAFPTTGSMLLLMRHANRSIDDYTRSRNLAFTTWLGRVTNRTLQGEYPPGSGNLLTAPIPVGIREDAQVDNGRMPVFDEGMEILIGLPDPVRIPAHHVPPCETEPNYPGALHNLPWGQLVFDYFTALPLKSRGPFWDDDPVAPIVGLPDSIPRVDLDGVRVHGRINLNAAPWRVLSGLPLIPMEKFTVPFRAKLRWGAGLVDLQNLDPLNALPADFTIPDDQAGMIGRELGQSIVAYRDLRVIADGVTGVTTGDYGPLDLLNGRDWGSVVPAARRGTGFMSVGELANLRHPDATSNPRDPNLAPDQFSFYRIDGGDLRWTNSDYVKAVALLVALGDWVTVRSHVFTLYGVLRGEMDEEILGEDPTADDVSDAAVDVDTRAIRFQETIDRLPTFLGAPTPVRIGERVVKKYNDVRND